MYVCVHRVFVCKSRKFNAETVAIRYQHLHDMRSNAPAEGNFTTKLLYNTHYFSFEVVRKFAIKADSVFEIEAFFIARLNKNVFEKLTKKTSQIVSYAYLKT